MSTSRGASSASSFSSRRAEVESVLLRHFNHVGAAAILGNISQETGARSFDYRQQEIGGKGGYGLFQFTGPTQKNYKDWLSFTGKTDSSESQILYVHSAIYERGAPQNFLGAGNAKILAKAFEGNDVQGATKLFMEKFERPKKAYDRHGQDMRHLDRRIQAADEAYSRLQRKPNRGPRHETHTDVSQSRISSKNSSSHASTKQHAKQQHRGETTFNGANAAPRPGSHSYAQSSSTTALPALATTSAASVKPAPAASTASSAGTGVLSKPSVSARQPTPQPMSQHSPPQHGPHPDATHHEPVHTAWSRSYQVSLSAKQLSSLSAYTAESALAPVSFMPHAPLSSPLFSNESPIDSTGCRVQLNERDVVIDDRTGAAISASDHNDYAFMQMDSLRQQQMTAVRGANGLPTLHQHEVDSTERRLGEGRVSAAASTQQVQEHAILTVDSNVIDADLHLFSTHSTAQQQRESFLETTSYSSASSANGRPNSSSQRSLMESSNENMESDEGLFLRHDKTRSSTADGHGNIVATRTTDSWGPSSHSIASRNAAMSAAAQCGVFALTSGGVSTGAALHAIAQTAATRAGSAFLHSVADQAVSRLVTAVTHTPLLVEVAGSHDSFISSAAISFANALLTERNLGAAARESFLSAAGSALSSSTGLPLSLSHTSTVATRGMFGQRISDYHGSGYALAYSTELAGISASAGLQFQQLSYSQTSGGVLRHFQGHDLGAYGNVGGVGSLSLGLTSGVWRSDERVVTDVDHNRQVSLFDINHVHGQLTLGGQFGAAVFRVAVLPAFSSHKIEYSMEGTADGSWLSQGNINATPSSDAFARDVLQQRINSFHEAQQSTLAAPQSSSSSRAAPHSQTGAASDVPPPNSLSEISVAELSSGNVIAGDSGSTSLETAAVNTSTDTAKGYLSDLLSTQSGEQRNVFTHEEQWHTESSCFGVLKEKWTVEADNGAYVRTGVGSKQQTITNADGSKGPTTATAVVTQDAKYFHEETHNRQGDVQHGNGSVGDHPDQTTQYLRSVTYVEDRKALQTGEVVQLSSSSSVDGSYTRMQESKSLQSDVMNIHRDDSSTVDHRNNSATLSSHVAAMQVDQLTESRSESSTGFASQDIHQTATVKVYERDVTIKDTHWSGSADQLETQKSQLDQQIAAATLPTHAASDAARLLDSSQLSTITTLTSDSHTSHGFFTSSTTTTTTTDTVKESDGSVISHTTNTTEGPLQLSPCGQGLLSGLTSTLLGEAWVEVQVGHLSRLNWVERFGFVSSQAAISAIEGGARGHLAWLLVNAVEVGNVQTAAAAAVGIVGGSVVFQLLKKALRRRRAAREHAESSKKYTVWREIAQRGAWLCAALQQHRPAVQFASIIIPCTRDMPPDVVKHLPPFSMQHFQTLRSPAKKIAENGGDYPARWRAVAIIAEDGASFFHCIAAVLNNCVQAVKDIIRGVVEQMTTQQLAVVMALDAFQAGDEGKKEKIDDDDVKATYLKELERPFYIGGALELALLSHAPACQHIRWVVLQLEESTKQFLMSRVQPRFFAAVDPRQQPNGKDEVSDIQQPVEVYLHVAADKHFDLIVDFDTSTAETYANFLTPLSGDEALESAEATKTRTADSVLPWITFSAANNAYPPSSLQLEEWADRSTAMSLTSSVTSLAVSFFQSFFRSAARAAENSSAAIASRTSMQVAAEVGKVSLSAIAASSGIAAGVTLLVEMGFLAYDYHKRKISRSQFKEKAITSAVITVGSSVAAVGVSYGLATAGVAIGSGVLLGAVSVAVPAVAAVVATVALTWAMYKFWRWWSGPDWLRQLKSDCELLGADPDLELQQSAQQFQRAIKKLYRTQALPLHPDKPGGDHDKFTELTERVYRILDAGAKYEKEFESIHRRLPKRSAQSVNRDAGAVQRGISSLGRNMAMFLQWINIFKKNGKEDTNKKMLQWEQMENEMDRPD